MNSVRLFLLAVVAAAYINVYSADNMVPSGFRMLPQWSIGADFTGGYVFGTNSFLKGNNEEGRIINSTFGGSLRAGFRFNPNSREGMLYKGLYQGVAVEIHSFNAGRLLGTPVSLYTYQGAPFVHLGSRLSLGYEWQFGAAFGWKHYDKDISPDNGAVSTSVTAHMGLGLRLCYDLTERWQLSASLGVTHYSNGNTSLPNAGVNAVSAALGVAYIINPLGEAGAAPAELIADADRKHWFYDIVVFGAWRRRVINVGYEPQLCPGKFGVLGVQFAPMFKFNRYFAAGAALDMKYDESSGLLPYWVDGTYDENIKFYRPPFGKQLSIGISAHAEFIMPVFAVNAGLGYDIMSPKGEKRFYQSLTLKTFVTDKLFLNAGYRLGNFKDPQNLMLGVGVRF